MRKNTAESFWARVSIHGPDECWLWTGYVMPSGYARMSWGCVYYYVHRIAYALAVGKISFWAPKDKKTSQEFVLHSCDNRVCCSPKHLFLGGYQTNILDMYAKGRGATRRGAENINAKLSNRQVVEMRTRYAAKDGTSYSLAEEYGIGQSTAMRILSGQSYKDNPSA